MSASETGILAITQPNAHTNSTTAHTTTHAQYSHRTPIDSGVVSLPSHERLDLKPGFSFFLNLAHCSSLQSSE